MDYVDRKLRITYGEHDFTSEAWNGVRRDAERECRACKRQHVSLYVYHGQNRDGPFCAYCYGTATLALSDASNRR